MSGKLEIEKYPTKKYLHFDYRVRIENKENYVTNPKKIARHSFLPMLHFESTSEKYVNVAASDPNCPDKKRKEKVRDIKYAGHLDNFIYKYYAEMLNESYNKYCKNMAIDECVTAYRNNKYFQSNVDFSAEIINQIVEYESAYIFIGDFTKYFDKINHQLLKTNLKIVLRQNRLDKDWYNVYKSITKYGYYRKEDIEAYCGTEKQLKSKKQRAFFDSLKDFRKFQKVNKPNFNKETYGIPQGSAISAVFANVYALSFDLEVNQLVSEYDGIYRRYSDDFIVVIPKKKMINEEEFNELRQKILKAATENEIELQPDKTKYYDYRECLIYNLDKNEKSHIDYLGFTFDGQTVRMRGKSPYKFYRKARKLIEFAKVQKNKKGLTKLPYRKQIYKLYTDLGESKSGRNSFIDYAKNAQSKFDQISPNTDNLILEQIKNRKKKIEKMMGVKIHTKI